MRYIVYFDRHDKYAAIHKTTCAYPRMHGGVGRANPTTGWYSKILGSLEDARLEGKASGYKIIHCGTCGPA